jgi:hypothetical protein
LAMAVSLWLMVVDIPNASNGRKRSNLTQDR